MTLRRLGNSSRIGGSSRARCSRRSLLASALAGAIGLPWLESVSLRRAHAQERPPRRFVVMFSPNGTLYDAWAPQGGERDFTLSPILSPLEPQRERLVIVGGLEQRGAGGDQHQRGIGGMLTGAGLLSGAFGGMGSPTAGWAEGPSVDQRIAAAIGGGTPFRSLELGVQVGTADNYGRMIYRDRNQPLPPREDPARVFDDLFGAALASPQELEARRARRSSILDFVRAEFSELSVRVSAADRQRLEAHLEQLRAVERRLDRGVAETQSCQLPPRPAAASSDNDAFPTIGELQLDLLALALACGQTHVASLQWSRSVSFTRFTWLGIEADHHELSHRPDSDAEAREQLLQINQWYASRFAGLLGRLAAIDEGEGSLLDQCLLLWCNELGKGNVHSPENAPYVLAGSAGGALSTGRWLHYENQPSHNDLLLSLLRIFDLPDATFGRPEWCTGPLPNLI